MMRRALGMFLESRLEHIGSGGLGSKIPPTPPSMHLSGSGLVPGVGFYVHS